MPASRLNSPPGGVLLDAADSVAIGDWETVETVALVESDPNREIVRINEQEEN